MRLNVLIVDDESIVSDFISLHVRKEAPRFSIVKVESGRECLEYLSKNRVDCILSDYQMPGMDGMELLNRIRSEGYDVPFIFITGQGNEEVAREAFKNGAYDYFTKENGFAHFARITNSVRQAVRHLRAEKAKRAAEIELLEEKDKLDSVLASIGDAISIQDTGFKVMYQNPAHKALTGEHVGEHCYKAYVKNDHVCKGCPVARAFEDGGVHTLQKPRETGDGLMYVEIKASPLKDSSGRIVAGIESIRDVTERIEAEGAVVEGGLFLESIFASIQDGISILDDDLNVVRVNPTVERWYSHNMPLVGKKCYEAFHGKRQRCDVCPSIRAIETGRATSEEVPRHGLDGEIVGWLELRSFPFLDKATGRRKGVIEYAHELSGRKSLEQVN